ncbi:MAG: class I SAM-dependent methyltransferase, partial [bacterium]
KVSASHRILDIGCGTGMLLDYLPSTVRYFGFDGSKSYIEFAKKKYGDRGVFVHQELNESNVAQYSGFDRVVAVGLLHHLDDSQAIQLFSIAKAALKPGTGEFHSIDPCYVTNQSITSRFLVNRDRGQNVRTPSQYEALAANVFSSVQLTSRNDMLRIPYNHAILQCI